MKNKYHIQKDHRVYAIGDIHGYAETLTRLHEKIDADIAVRPIDQVTIIYLGDYIDRGPNSKGVIDILLQRQKDLPEIKHVFLMGNHEEALFNKFLHDPNGKRHDWLQWGGVEAAASYGVFIDKNQTQKEQAEYVAKELSKALPQTHKEFLQNLELYHIIDDYLFVHAGIRPNIEIEQQTKQDLTFTREPFMSFEGEHPYYVVHGHSATKDHKVDIRHNRINLDTGHYNGGPLSCAVIEDNNISIIDTQ